jgi:hypothetical protein
VTSVTRQSRPSTIAGGLITKYGKWKYRLVRPRTSFTMSVPFAVLALIAVIFIKEKALLTTSGAERRAAEEDDKLDA